MLATVLGCSSLNPFGGSSDQASNRQKPAGNDRSGDKTITDRAVDTAVGEETTGVPECDDVIAYFDREITAAEEEGFVAKAVKATVLNRLKEGLRKSIQENKSDPAEMAKTCKDFHQQLEKYKAEEDAKKAEQ